MEGCFAPEVRLVNLDRLVRTVGSHVLDGVDHGSGSGLAELDKEVVERSSASDVNSIDVYAFGGEDLLNVKVGVGSCWGEVQSDVEEVSSVFIDEQGVCILFYEIFDMLKVSSLDCEFKSKMAVF